jgi:hypothetical protein
MRSTSARTAQNVSIAHAEQNVFSETPQPRVEGKDLVRSRTEGRTLNQCAHD